MGLWSGLGLGLGLCLGIGLGFGLGSSLGLGLFLGIRLGLGLDLDQLFLLNSLAELIYSPGAHGVIDQSAFGVNVLHNGLQMCFRCERLGFYVLDSVSVEQAVHTRDPARGLDRSEGGVLCWDTRKCTGGVNYAQAASYQHHVYREQN